MKCSCAELPAPVSPSSRAAQAIGTIAAVLTLAYVLWPLREAYRGVDFRYLYAAGKTWISGKSPYDYVAWHRHFEFSDPPFTIHRSQAPFLYPPHWAPFAVGLATLPYRLAVHVWDVINVSAHLATLALCLHFVRQTRTHRWSGPVALVAVAIANANGAVRFALWEPQMGFLPALGIVGAFYSWHKKHMPMVAICTYCILLKPQFGLISLAFISIAGGHAGVLLGLALATAASMIALFPVVAPDPLYNQLLDCAARHTGDLYNVPSNFTHISSWLLQATGVDGLAWLQIPSGIAFILWLKSWYLRQSGSQGAALRCLALCCAATPVLVPVHQYDLILYTPLLVVAALSTPHWIKFAALAVAAQITGRAHALPEMSLALGALLTLGATVFATPLTHRISAQPRSPPHPPDGPNM